MDKRGIGILILLMLFIGACAPGPSLHLSVEFVSEPPVEIFYRYITEGMPGIAVGDLTGDQYPEISVAAGAWVPGEEGRSGKPEDYFYSHPIVFSWNGETFEPLEAAWTGISSYVPQVPIHDAQNIPIALLVADVDRDHMNELLVGTGGRPASPNKGALYIFQWDGTGFIAEYSDYCMGIVHRLDLIGDADSVAISTWGRPTGAGFYDHDMCPDVLKDPNEPREGLYVLRATEENHYETHSLAVDDSSTVLVANSDHFSDTQFVRGQFFDSSDVVDWETTQVLNYEGEITTDTLLLEIENLIGKMATADLEGDATPEIIVLAAKEWREDIRLSAEDKAVWLVFQQSSQGYQLIYEGEGDFSPDPSQGSLRKRFVAGDVDDDGADEILAGNGVLYKWVDGRLVPQMDLMEAMGIEFCHGLESMYVGDVHNDGKNRIVFVARDPKDTKYCSNDSPFRVYVVSVSSAPQAE